MLLDDHVDLAVDGGVTFAFTARTFTGFAGDDIAFDVGQGMGFALALARPLPSPSPRAPSRAWPCNQGKSTFGHH